MRNIHVLFAFLLAFFMPGAAWAASSLEEDQRAAVILAYGRVGEDAYPETNIRAEQFTQHIEEILHDGYKVISLPDALERLKSGENPPPNTLVITFEGGYKSALENAMPVLLHHKIPFTIFYAPGKASQNSNEFLDWKDLEFLAKHPYVTLGILPSSYERLAEALEPEIRSAINASIAAHRNHFGTAPRFFAYPFGEYSIKLKDIAQSYNFSGAFTLNSGAASGSSDFVALPRFAMTESYGDLERFRLISHALPLPVRDITPEAPISETYTNPGFTTSKSLETDLNALSCYVSGQESPEISIIGTRVELRPQSKITERTRINCTLPGPEDRWRWLGMLIIPPADKEDSNPEPDELP